MVAPRTIGHRVEAVAVSLPAWSRRLSPYRLLAAAFLAVLGVASALAVDGTPDAPFAALFVLAVGFVAVSAVRERDAFTLGQAVWTALVFSLLVYAPERPAGVFPTAVAALAVVGAYSYLAGTS